MPVVLSDYHRRCILLVALAYLCVSVHGLSYAVSAESLFIDKVAYYESGVSEAAEPGPMPTILNWTASRSRHLAPGGHSRAGTCEAKRRGYGALGRDDIALEIPESLNAGIGAPARLMRIAGPRGSGKLFCSAILGIVRESLDGRPLLFLLALTYCWTRGIRLLILPLRPMLRSA